MVRSEDEAEERLSERAQDVMYSAGLESFEVEEGYFKPLLRQVFAAIAPLLLTAAGAMAVGYSAILLPQLEKNKELEIDRNMSSWIASTIPLFMAIGCLFGGWATDRFGRKPTNIITSLLMACGWIVICTIPGTFYLLLGRTLTGFGAGASVPSSACYMAEMSHPSYRPLFLSSISLAINLGLFLVHLMGAIWHWKVVGIICCLFHIIIITLLVLTPESHIWYIRKREFARARKSFCWFRGCSLGAKEELIGIISSGKNRKEEVVDIKQLLKECFKGTFIKPFLIVNLYFLTVQLTGNNAVVFYTVGIMQGSIPSLNQYLATLCIDAIRIVISVFGCALAKRYKVRYLTMFSGITSVLSLYLLAGFIYFSKIYTKNEIVVLLPMLGFILYIICINLGLLTVPWTIYGELFPPSKKGIGTGLSMSLNFLSMFAIVKTCPDLFNLMGIDGAFFIYGTGVLICVVILYYVLPETKNKTLEEIHTFFVKNKEKRCQNV